MAKEIRFAVGSPEDVRSSVWRLWANKDDLYLAARTTAGLSKISFHKSGKCRFAVVQSTPRPPLKSWARPRESEPGVTPQFSIIVPPFEIEDSFRDKLPPSHKSVAWVDAPAPGTKVIILVLQTKTTTTEADFLKSAGSKPISVLGNVQLTTEIAWLVAYTDALTEYERGWVADLIQKTKIHLEPGSSQDSIAFAYVHSFEAHLNPPAIVDMPLGRGNLDIPS